MGRDLYRKDVGYTRSIVYEWKKWGTGGPCFYSQTSLHWYITHPLDIRSILLRWFTWIISDPWFRRVGDPRFGAHAHAHARRFESDLAPPPSLAGTVCRQAGPPWLFRRCRASALCDREFKKHFHFLRRRKRVYVLRSARITLRGCNGGVDFSRPSWCESRFLQGVSK